ncbi:MAG TPA: hypothetical protein VFF53_08450 [Geobacteraceae bacterium]|nr:hypothetical protein [Geobacteraceae bacterium]
MPIPDEQLQDLVAELKYLRGIVHDIGENLIIRKEGEIESLISHLQTLPRAKLRRIGKEWLSDARGLNVKPAKGRLKDLHRLDRLLVSLCDAVISCEDEEKKSKPPARKVSGKKKSTTKSSQEKP